MKIFILLFVITAAFGQRHLKNRYRGSGATTSHTLNNTATEPTESKPGAILDTQVTGGSVGTHTPDHALLEGLPGARAVPDSAGPVWGVPDLGAYDHDALNTSSTTIPTVSTTYATGGDVIETLPLTRPVPEKNLTTPAPISLPVALGTVPIAVAGFANTDPLRYHLADLFTNVADLLWNGTTAERQKPSTITTAGSTTTHEDDKTTTPAPKPADKGDEPHNRGWYRFTIQYPGTRTLF